MSQSNASLVDEFGSGEPSADGSAFDRMVDRYHEMIFRLCFRCLGHRQDAEDATQETFTRLARYWQKWDRDRPLEPYLKTIAGNRCRTAISRRRQFQSLESVAEPQTTQYLHDRQADALREEVQLMLTGLPEPQRLAFEMFHQESFTYAEIAEALNCPVGTVKTWVHRARQELIQHMRRRGVLSTDNTAVPVEGARKQ